MLKITTDSAEMIYDDDGRFTGDKGIITWAKIILDNYGPQDGDPFKYLHIRLFELYPHALIESTAIPYEDVEGLYY